MDWQSDPNESTPFSFQEQDDRPNKRLADPITTPRKGPLALSNRVKQHVHPAVTKRETQYPQFPKTRQKYLNRFPVANVQRPIDAIESSLDGLSFAQLKHHAFTDWTGERHNPILPTLNPLMKYTPVGHQGNFTTESHTHKASGPMDILITYSRHTTPNFPILPKNNQIPSNNYAIPSWISPQYLDMSTVHRRHITPLSTQPRTSLSTRMHTSHTKNDSEELKTPEHSPLSPRYALPQGHLMAGLMRPTIAPHSLHALAVHKFKPVTAQTILKGKRLYPHTLDSKRVS